MILIADSGSTKVDWAFLSKGKPVRRVKTSGINPAQLDDDGIVSILKDNLLPLFPEVSHLYFFGAGIVGDSMKDRLSRCFQSVWHTAVCTFASDIQASAIALFGNARGIACILGTGSNSAVVENARIVSNVPGGGFVLGDEGGGVWIGKMLLSDYIKKVMPSGLREEFEREYSLSYPMIVSRVYKEEKPAAYIAGLSRFASSRLGDPYIRELVIKGFEDFIYRNVMRYDGYETLEVGFVGSIAYYYEPLLREVAEKKGIRVGKIIKAPIDSLIEYYENN